MLQFSKSSNFKSLTQRQVSCWRLWRNPLGRFTGMIQRAEVCSSVGMCKPTWICSGRLVLMVYSSSLVGFSLHMSTSSRSMPPLIRRPLATRPTRVTPQSNGMLSDLRPGTHRYSQNWCPHLCHISLFLNGLRRTWMVEASLLMPNVCTLTGQLVPVRSKENQVL